MAHAHTHAVTNSTPRRLAIALVLTVGFVLLEAGDESLRKGLLEEAENNYRRVIADL